MLNAAPLCALLLPLGCFLAVPALAQIEIDGSLESEYGTAIAVQNVNTTFGDNDNADALAANGSELDAIFVVAESGMLYIFVTGNLESNFNKLDLFIDYTTGGQNTLRNDNANIDFDGLNRMGGDEFTGGALIFDEGFDADFYLTCNLGGDPITIYANAAEILTDGGGAGGYLGSSTDNPNGLGGLLSDSGIELAINNSNVGGVTGGQDAGDGSGVMTGIEIAIPTSALPGGYTAGDGLRIVAFINNSDHSYLSNQVLGPLGPFNSLGEPRAVDFTLIEECQFASADGDTGKYDCAAGGGGGDDPPEPTITMDGEADSEFGAALAVQDTQTNFGDANNGLLDWCNGSEIDSIFGFIDDDRLNLVIAGNLESNYNKLNLFLDFADGGQNQLRGDNSGISFGALNRLGDDGSGNGLMFDEEFSADLWFAVDCGGEQDFWFYARTAQVLTDGGGSGTDLGGAGSGYVIEALNGMQVAMNNSNIAGVDSGTGLSDGSGVSTGIEISIPLIRLEGYEKGTSIRASAFIANNDNSYLSNQVMGGIGGGDNLAESRNVMFSEIPGDQFVTVELGGGGSDCVGDLDNSGAVDGGDLTMLLGSWGGDGVADLDNSGTVDGADLTMLLGAWGACS